MPEVNKYVDLRQSNMIAVRLTDKQGMPTPVTKEGMYYLTIEYIEISDESCGLGEVSCSAARSQVIETVMTDAV